MQNMMIKIQQCKPNINYKYIDFVNNSIIESVKCHTVHRHAVSLKILVQEVLKYCSKKGYST